MTGPMASEGEARAILARPIVPVVRFDGQPLTQEQVEVLRRLYAPGQLEQIGEWFARLNEALGTAFKNIQDTMRSMGLVADPGEEYDDDPRRRALALRRNRNTGPARPSAAQARRPRRHK